MDIRLSSYKRDLGVKELFSSDFSEYWATGDALPHGIQIDCTRPTFIEAARDYLNFTRDDSYTLQKFEVGCGLASNTMDPVTSITLLEPGGYFHLTQKDSALFIRSFF